MNLRLTRRLARTMAALLLAALPEGAALAGSDDADETDVPEPAEMCLSCHAIGADEPVLEGPTLWKVVGRRIASVEGFDYSDALRKQEGSWDREKLDRWLAAPQAFAPGTRMKLGGVRNAADREQVLDFLETLAAGGND